MALQMRPPVEEKIPSTRTETTAPEKTPVLPQTRVEAAEIGRLKLRTPRLMDRGNWLLLVI